MGGPFLSRNQRRARSLEAVYVFGALASELPTTDRGAAAWNRAVTSKDLADGVGHPLASDAAGSGSRGKAAGRTFSLPMPSALEKFKPAGSDAAAKSPIFATMQIAQTVSTPAEMEDELRQLITAASS